MAQFTIINKIHDELFKLEAFQESHPSKQPDYPEDLIQTVVRGNEI